MVDESVESAKSLSLAAVVVQVIMTAFLVFVLVAFLSYFVANPPANSVYGNVTISVSSITNTIILIVGVATGVVGILWVILDYYLVYMRIKEGKIRASKDASLVLGILQLILGGIFSGVLLIMVYSQLNSSMSQQADSP